MATERGATVAEICATTAVPALAMALGSAAVSAGEPSEQLQSRLQHLSAGVLIGAVVTEIFPILKQRLSADPAGSGLHGDHWSGMLAAALGCGGALLLMYGVKSLNLEADEGGETSDDERPDSVKRRNSSGDHVWLAGTGGSDESTKLRMRLARLQAHSTSLTRLVESEEVNREAVDEEVHGIDFLVDSARRVCRGADPIDKRNAARLRHHVEELIEDIAKLRDMDASQTCAMDRQLRAAAATLRHIHSHAERGTFRRWAPRRMSGAEPPHAKHGKTAPLPVGLIVAVVVDSVIDGMLIGLSGSVAYTSGWLMALATAIEMAFLGYSFACSLVKSVRPGTAAALLALPPVAMLVASVAACVGATFVERTAAFCGLIAFALVALLFLVVQELLLEAKEKEGGGAWHIGIWFYLGLLLSVGMDVGL